VAVTGLLRSAPPSPYFDASQIARQACAAPGDLEAKADAFLAAATRQLQAVVDVHIRNPQWPDFFPADAPVLSAVFAGFDGSKPLLVYRALNVGPLNLLRPERTSGAEITIMGSVSGIKNYIDLNPDWRAQLADIEIARKFVDLEMGANPSRVGPPRSILEINADGSRWIEEGVCRAE